MTILVLGGTGLLGSELLRQARLTGHDIAATYATRAGSAVGVRWRHLDIRRRDTVSSLLAEVRPDLVVNAAYRQHEWASTADGAAHVAVAARAVDARLVHVSSDALFSGTVSPYDETAAPDPITPYGAAKAAAETAVRALAPAAVIARTSLIVGDGTSPQERLVHSLATGSGDGVLFTDDIRCPVHLGDLASALLELGASAYAGVHHLAGVDAVSRHELGALIARRDGLDETRLPDGRRTEVGPPGPLDVRLDCTLSQRRLDTRLRGAREFLAMTPS